MEVASGARPVFPPSANPGRLAGVSRRHSLGVFCQRLRQGELAEICQRTTTHNARYIEISSACKGSRCSLRASPLDYRMPLGSTSLRMAVIKREALPEWSLSPILCGHDLPEGRKSP